MSQPERHGHVGQLTIDDLHDIDQPDPDTEPDAEPDNDTHRHDVLEGGARYRQTARDHADPTPSIDQECQNCGAHVGRQYVRVMGLNGQVHACPTCADTTEVLNGAAAGRHRRETL